MVPDILVVGKVELQEKFMRQTSQTRRSLGMVMQIFVMLYLLNSEFLKVSVKQSKAYVNLTLMFIAAFQKFTT